MITGADASAPLLGTAPGLTVEFHARHLTLSPEPGFSTPEWLGYTALPAYTLPFDSGGDPAFASQTVWPGETLRLPAASERTGYTFTGWYTSPGGGEPVTFIEPPVVGGLVARVGMAFLPCHRWSGGCCHPLERHALTADRDAAHLLGEVSS